MSRSQRGGRHERPGADRRRHRPRSKEGEGRALVEGNVEMEGGGLRFDVEGAFAMLRIFTDAVDVALKAAQHSCAPAGMVMALDEASLGLHRACVALANADSLTGPAGDGSEMLT